MGLCDILSATHQASRPVITESGNLQKLLESAQKSHFSEATEGTQTKQTKTSLGFNFLSNYVTQSHFTNNLHKQTNKQQPIRARPMSPSVFIQQTFLSAYVQQALTAVLRSHQLLS